ncbi:glycosyltransferase family A protein [Eubacterium sp.]
MESELISVITPTYNRAKLLHRVYDSLCKQTYKSFEWIIVDDGSTDNTSETVEQWMKDKKIDIKYVYQKNSGKHIAVNKAVKLSRGNWIVIADSDDSFRRDAFSFFMDEIKKLPKKCEGKEYRGISCRCFDEDNSTILGDSFPQNKYYIDAREDDFKYKLKIQGELWGIIRKEAMLKYPFPQLDDAHYYPESVIWDSMSDEYITRYINEPIRYYYRDADNSITKNKKYNRYNENYNLWIHNINRNSRYFRYSPKMVIKSFVGCNMDTLFCDIPYKKTLERINTFWKKVICIFTYPLGYVMYIRRR